MTFLMPTCLYPSPRPPPSTGLAMGHPQKTGPLLESASVPGVPQNPITAKKGPQGREHLRVRRNQRIRTSWCVTSWASHGRGPQARRPKHQQELGASGGLKPQGRVFAGPAPSLCPNVQMSPFKGTRVVQDSAHSNLNLDLNFIC